MTTACACGCGQIPPIATRSRSARGWRKGHPTPFCPGHKRAGDPVELFFRRVQMDGPVTYLGTQCWMWTGTTNGQPGYGSFRTGTVHAGLRTVLAHVYIYEQTRGPVPQGLVIDHLCRNRLCVNPIHIEA